MHTRSQYNLREHWLRTQTDRISSRVKTLTQRLILSALIASRLHLWLTKHDASIGEGITSSDTCCWTGCPGYSGLETEHVTYAVL